MKAIIIAAPGDARLVETEKPKVGPGDVLSRVVYSGICGTDLSILSGDTSLVRDGLIKYPVRIGHEWSGIVEEVGAEVKGFKPGDRVVSDTGVVCGKCEDCLAGHMSNCKHIRSLGTINCWDGSFAEYILMPEKHMYKLPDNVNLDEAALIEPATISLAGINKIDFSKGGNVLVIGTGAIGLTAVALAKYKGASKVLLCGRKQYKLNIGKEVGADILINSTKEKLQEEIMKYTDGEGVDAVIETSGNVDVVNECLNVTKPRSVVALIGFYEKMVEAFYIDKVVLNQLHLIGILGEFGLVQEIIDILASGKMNFKPLITHKINVDEAVNAMKTAGEKNEKKIKMLVEFSKEK